MARHRRDLHSEAVAAEFDRLLALATPREDLVCIGADLRPGTLLAAYSRGLFPMGVGRHGTGQIGWWSPDPRGVLPLDGLRVSRSLHQSCRRLQVTVDTAFAEVIRHCADPDRPGRWITPQLLGAYEELHRLGLAHSIETWLEGELVGGLYGVGMGGLFAGESMFHHARDASKVALVGLVQLLGAGTHPRLLDVQWRTDHLTSLGVVEVSRTRYLGKLPEALAAPGPPWCAGPLALEV